MTWTYRHRSNLKRPCGCFTAALHTKSRRFDTVRAHEGSAGRTASDVAAATLLARSGGRTHEQCRGIAINPDDLAVQLWAIPHSEDVPSSVELRWRSGEHQAALT